MEELQSTEILDREILDDARKKAARVLKLSDDDIKAQNNEWEKKITDCIDDLNKKYSQQEKIEADNVMARLPIDKLRLKIEKIENALITAEDLWYESLDRGYILKLLSNELKRRMEFIKEQGIYNDQLTGNKIIKAFVFMFKKDEAQKLLKEFNLNCEIEEIHAPSRYPQISIETDDLMITVSIQRIIDYFLHVKRTQLVEALVGGDFLENI